MQDAINWIAKLQSEYPQLTQKKRTGKESIETESIGKIKPKRNSKTSERKTLPLKQKQRFLLDLTCPEAREIE